MDKYKFGEFVYNKRKSLNLTQEELGYKLGVSNKAVSKWETGDTFPDIQLLEALANLLHVTLDELITQEKPNRELVYTPNPKTKRFNIFLGIALLLVSFLLIIVTKHYISDNANNRTPREIPLTLENIYAYYSITPCYKSALNNDELEVSSSILLYNSSYLANENVQISISYVLHYYYLTKEGKIGVISYLNKTVDLDINNIEKTFSILFKPKEELTDFQSFSSFEIEYQVLNISGKLIRK